MKLVYNSKRNFSLLVVGQFVSILGDRISTSVFLTIAAMIVADMSSSYQSSVIIAFQILPFLIFGYFFGLMADLVQKRRILIVADLGRAFMILLLYFFHTSLWFLYFTVFVIGFFTAMFEPAKKSILPFLVKKSNLVFFNKFFAFMEIVAMFVGLGVGAFLLSEIGVEHALLLDASTFLISMVLLLFIKYRDESEVLAKKIPSLESFKEGLVRHKKELGEGLIYLKSNANVLYVISNLVFFHFFTVALFAATVIDFSIRTFDVGREILISLGLDFSNMLVGSHSTFIFLFVAIGAMFAPLVQMFLKKYKESVLSVLAYLVGAVFLILWGVFSFSLPFRIFYLSVYFFMFLIGIIAGVQYIRYVYLIQLNCDKEFMGRVMSVCEIVWSLALFVGILVGSFFNTSFGYTWGFFACALFYFLGAGSFYFSKGKISW